MSGPVSRGQRRGARGEGAAELRLFAYGSLKRGQEHHDPYCSGFRAVELGSVRGALYGSSDGYPVLLVPCNTVLAWATGNPERDLALQECWAARLASGHGQDGRLGGSADERAGRVEGELFWFADGAVRLAAVDELEGFRPGRPAGRASYVRVLVPVRREGGGVTTAWTYTAPVPWRPGPSLRRLESGVWG